jgi:formate dehydrogenase major subunit
VSRSARHLHLDRAGLSPRPAEAEVRAFKLARTTETRNTCLYCSVSCGVIMYSLGDKAKNAKSSIIHIEGDPDHPIKRGTLCPKGGALLDFIKAPTRLLYPEYRAPGSAEWKRVSWDWAMERIAKLVKEDRDKNFIAKNQDDVTVNRWGVDGLPRRLGNDQRNRVSHLQSGAELRNRRLRQPSERKPWNPRYKVIEWNGNAWAGADVPDYPPATKPEAGMNPFIMNPEGVARLFTLGMMRDGPFPEHYEPFEAPVANALHPRVNANPVARVFKGDLEVWYGG